MHLHLCKRFNLHITVPITVSLSVPLLFYSFCVQSAHTTFFREMVGTAITTHTITTMLVVGTQSPHWGSAFVVSSISAIVRIPVPEGPNSRTRAQGFPLILVADRSTRSKIRGCETQYPPPLPVAPTYQYPRAGIAPLAELL